MTDLQIAVMAGTIVFFLFAAFVVSFYVIFLKRKTQNRLEKAALKAQYEQEILNSANEIQEHTMKEISRELHDNVGQMLTLVKIQLNNFSAEQPENAKIINSKDYINSALTDLRSLSKSLNNDNILGAGLASAIRFEISRLQKIGAFQIHYDEKIEGKLLDSRQEIVVFRIFQELLQNILKHAQAKNVIINLEESDSLFKLNLNDDGIGFDFELKQNEKGFGTGSGLANLLHRANLLGGKLEVKSSNKGTTTQLIMLIDKKFS